MAWIQDFKLSESTSSVEPAVVRRPWMLQEYLSYANISKEKHRKRNLGITGAWCLLGKQNQSIMCSLQTDVQLIEIIKWRKVKNKERIKSGKNWNCREWIEWIENGDRRGNENRNHFVCGCDWIYNIGLVDIPSRVFWGFNHLEDVYGLGLAFKQRMIIRWSALDDYGLDDPGISNPNDPGVVDSWTVSFTFGGDDVNISARINW